MRDTLSIWSSGLLILEISCFIALYYIPRNIGDGFNLVIWRFKSQLPN